MEFGSRLEQCRNEGPGERVEGEMSDASDSDDVSKRFGLKNSGSSVDNCEGEISDASDSDVVSKRLGLVFCLKYNQINTDSKLQPKLQNPNQPIYRLFGGGVDEGDAGCWKRVRIANRHLS